MGLKSLLLAVLDRLSLPGPDMTKFPDPIPTSVSLLQEDDGTIKLNTLNPHEKDDPTLAITPGKSSPIWPVTQISLAQAAAERNMASNAANLQHPQTNNSLLGRGISGWGHPGAPMGAIIQSAVAATVEVSGAEVSVTRDDEDGVVIEFFGGRARETMRSRNPYTSDTQRVFRLSRDEARALASKLARTAADL